MKQVFLTFKWSISRGQYTYGYNICTLYVDGKKVSSCKGGGYDMSGTCLGEWMEKNFQTELKTLDINSYYGVREYEGNICLDGGCGFSSMEKILNGLGYNISRNPNSTSKEQHYIVTSKSMTHEKIIK